MTTFNTGNPVPSTDAKDLSDNAENFDSAVNTQVDTWDDRLGVTRDTVTGRLKKMGYAVPIIYAGGELFTVNDNVKTVDEGGIIYAPVPSALPFTTSGTWLGDDDARFFVVQGLTSDSIKSEGYINIKTLSEAVLAVDSQENQYVRISDRSHGLFQYRTGQINNSYNKVACTGVPSLSLVNVVKGIHVFVDEFGAQDADPNRVYGAIQAACDYLLTTGGVIEFESETYEYDGEITHEGEGLKFKGLSGNGFSSQSSLLKNTVSGGNMATFGSTLFTTSRGIQMDNIAWQTSMGSTKGGVRIRRSNHCRFTNCGFSFFNDTAALKFFSDGDACIIPRITGCTFRDNAFHVDDDVSGGGVNTSLQVDGGYFTSGNVPGAVGIRFGETCFIYGGAAFDGHDVAVDLNGDGSGVMGCRFEFNKIGVKLSDQDRQRVIGNFFGHDFGVTPDTVAIMIESTSGSYQLLKGNSYQGYVDEILIDPAYSVENNIEYETPSTYKKILRESGKTNSHIIQNNFSNIDNDSEYIVNANADSISGFVRAHFDLVSSNSGLEIGTSTNHDVIFKVNDVESLRIARGTGQMQLKNGARIIDGVGSPEGNITAIVGSTFQRIDGGSGTSFYVKESGAGNVGWVAK